MACVILPATKAFELKTGFIPYKIRIPQSK
jgi:hypothetical protein